MLRSVALLGATLALGLAGCDEPIEGRTESALGLSFLVPEGLELRAGDTGIEMHNPRAQRTSEYIGVYPGQLPEHFNRNDQEIVDQGSRPAPYTVTMGGGGSGGPDYILSTEKMIEGRAVQIRGVTQTEWGQPSFATTWAVWDSLAAAD